MDKPSCNRLQVVLVEERVKQNELAGALHLNPNTISSWCRNETQPSLMQLYNISKFLRINMQRLIQPTDWSNETRPSPLELYRAEKEKLKTALSKKSNHKRKKTK